MRLSNTRYVPKIVAEIANEFKIYLPPRVSDTFIEDQAELEAYQMKAAVGRLFIKFFDVKKKRFIFIPK